MMIINVIILYEYIIFGHQIYILYFEMHEMPEMPETTATDKKNKITCSSER